MGRSTFPASQVAAMTVAGIAVTPKGDITLRPNQVRKTAIADAHTSKRKLQMMHVPGTLRVTLVTDNSDSEWQQVIQATEAPISISFLSGRQIEIPAADAVHDEGVSQNTTQGESNEVTFQFDSVVDSGPPQP